MAEWYEENEDEAASYFSDDSSTEEELLRVAEKLETMHKEKERNKKEAKKDEAMIRDIDDREASQWSVSEPRRLCRSQSITRPDQSPESDSLSFPANTESHLHKESPAASSPTNASIHGSDSDTRVGTKSTVDPDRNGGGGDGKRSLASRSDCNDGKSSRWQFQALRPPQSGRKSSHELVVSNPGPCNGASRSDRFVRRVESGTKKDEQDMLGKRQEYALPHPSRQQQYESIHETNTNGNGDDEKSIARNHRRAHDDEPTKKEGIVGLTRKETNDSTDSSSSNSSSSSSNNSSNGECETDLSDDDSTSISSTLISIDKASLIVGKVTTQTKKIANMDVDTRRSKHSSESETPSTTSTMSSSSPPWSQNSFGATHTSNGAVPNDPNYERKTTAKKFKSDRGVTNPLGRSTLLQRSTPTLLRNPYLPNAIADPNKTRESLSLEKMGNNNQQSQSILKKRKELKRFDDGHCDGLPIDITISDQKDEGEQSKPLTSKGAESSASMEQKTRHSVPNAEMMKVFEGFEAKGDTNDSCETVVVTDDHRDEPEEPEVSHVLYAPPVSRDGRHTVPNVHEFDCRSQPLHSRKTIPVRTSYRFFTPPIAKSMWPKFDRFNYFQSAMLDVLSNSDDSVVVSAPTGAGKSTIFEMAVARFLAMDLEAQEQQVHSNGSSSNPPVRSRSQEISKARKIVYIAPSKALCQERYEDWSRKLQQMNLGLEVALITGQDADNQHANNALADLIGGHLIVTTPEKWDSMTRRWNEKFFLFASVKLLLLDEVHLLGDENRGWCLESVITRMKTIHRAATVLHTAPQVIRTSSYPETNPNAIKSSFRMVAVSATLPNIADVADFLQAREAYTFDDSYRPVSLTKHVNAMGRVGKNEYRFWNTLIDHVPEIIRRFSHGKQSLIFCHSKNETERLTELLIQKKLGNEANVVAGRRWSESVGRMLAHGIAFHHAGLSKTERERIEEAFLNKTIKCLTATSTLAVGVNLPAHLVVVVGTKAYRRTKIGKGSKAGYEDIEVSTLLQMVGRAGRPGLDSTGVAVILTDVDSKKKIENIMQAGIGPAKSKLVPRLPEVINSEVSQRVITSKEGAMRWLQTTFLFSCMKHDRDAVSSAQNLTNETLVCLREIGLVEDEKTGLKPQAGSFIMNKRLISFEDMKAIFAFPFDVTQCQVLKSISKLKSLQSHVRNDQKRQLKEFHKTELMKYKLPGRLSEFRVKDESEKAFILLQSYVSRHRFANKLLDEEQITVRNEAIKFLEAAQEYSLKASKHGKVAFECHRLQRSLVTCLWGESSGVFNQFSWIGSSATGSNTLAFGGIKTFQDAFDSSEQKLNDLFSKAKILWLPENPGRVVKHTVNDLCRRRLRLSAKIEYTRNSNLPTYLRCTLKYNDPTLTITRNEGGLQDFKFSLMAYTDNSKQSCLIFEDDVYSPSSLSVPLPSYTFKKIYVHLMGTWIGFDETQIIHARKGCMNAAKADNSAARRPQIENEEDTTTTKRKIRQTERLMYPNPQPQKRQDETTKKSSKEPSPITPPNDYLRSIPNQQSLQEFWKESNRNGQAVHQSRAADNIVLSNRQKSDETTISVNITPTMPFHMKYESLHEKGAYELSEREIHGHFEANFANQRLDTLTTTHAESDFFYPRKSHRYNLPFRHMLMEDGMQKSQATATAETVEMDESVRMKSSLHRDCRGVQSMMTCEEITNADQIGANIMSTSGRRGNLAKTGWNQARKKQHRAQKRAFVEKKMNPFSFFAHDPNDSERHLEQLSHQNSIIPTRVRAKLKQSSIISNRKRNHNFLSHQDRRTRTARNQLSTQNPEQVLREKAFEQQNGHQRRMSQREQDRNYSPPHHYYQANVRPPSLPPVNARQENVERYRDQIHRFNNRSPTYELRNVSQFSQPLVSCGNQYISVATEAPEFDPTVQYDSFVSNIFEKPHELLMRPAENGRYLPLDSVRGTYDHVGNNSQLNFPDERNRCQLQDAYPPVDHESNFHDAFF